MNQAPRTSHNALALSLAALLAAVLSACGQAPAADDHQAELAIDPSFSAYVARFEQDSATQGKTVSVTDLTIRFGAVDVSGETGGRAVCEWASGQTPVITVSQAAWTASTEAEREELVFHELGHCVLGLKHEAGITGDGIPKSIMSPSKIDGAIYKQNREYYVKKLFGR